VKDTYGDKIELAPLSSVGIIELRVSDSANGDGVITAQADLSPAKARKLARKLRRAADLVEGIEPVESAYTLRLTRDQAKTLAVVLSRVGGTTGFQHLPVTARKYADEVYSALGELGFNGVRIGDHDPRFLVDDYQRSVHFVGVAE
jgi:hypothetical protein